MSGRLTEKTMIEKLVIIHITFEKKVIYRCRKIKNSIKNIQKIFFYNFSNYKKIFKN